VVIDGRIARTPHARVLRDKQPVFDGKMSTLRRFTEDVAEVRNGLECGIRLGEFNEYEVGDVIECYELEKLAQAL
jgi:translation initiation factor IF-2